MQSPLAPREPGSGHGRLWLLTRVAFILFAGAVIWLLTLTHQSDVEERRATLISDMLWLEQNLRFNLLRNEEHLAHLVSNRPEALAAFNPGARVVLGEGRGLRRIVWLDRQGQVRKSAPQGVEPQNLDANDSKTTQATTVRFAHSLGRATYSGAYPGPDGDWLFEVHVPVDEDGEFIGVAMGVYSVRRLLDDSVPWWLTERYRIALTDTSGKELVARSKVAPVRAEAGYQLSFDPPGHGLALLATPYAPPPSPVRNILSVALVGLAVAVLWSLWVLRRHAQRRLAAESALHAEHAFRQAMEDSLQTGMRARDLKGKVIYVNQAFCKMVGWSAEELIGREPPMPYWVDAEFAATAQLHDRILAGEGPEEGFELRLKRRNGEVFTALIHEAPLIDGSGRQTGWMSSIIDITDRKLAEEQARRQQERLQATSRLVAMGEMASSMAHELNQPLAAISSYSTAALNLLRSGSSADDVAPALEKSIEQTRRAGQVIRRIYRLARRSDGLSTPLRLDALVDAALALLEPDLQRQQVHVARDYAVQPTVVGDQVLLEQAIFNLLRNAMEAMQDTPAADRSLHVRLHGEAGYVDLGIADSGTGIAPDLADKLFDPLFTTKSEGMGMGLAICRTVVENHRGRLWFEKNADGHGTCFHMLLPIAKT